MESGMWVVRIGKYLVAVERTFDYSPGIYENNAGTPGEHVSKVSRSQGMPVMMYGHLIADEHGKDKIEEAR